MSGNPDGRTWLFKDRDDDLPHVAYYADAGNDLLRSIERGIIFLIAFWSGPAASQIIWPRLSHFDCPKDVVLRDVG